MKKFVVKMLEEEHAYLVLLAALDCVDDTKLVDRVILQPLFEDPLPVVKSKNGAKVVQYLLSPRDPRFFHQDLVTILVGGDNNEHSKKDTTVRRRELQSAAAPHLFKLISTHARELMLENATILLIALIMEANYDRDDLIELRKQAIQAILAPVKQEGLYYEQKDEANMHPIEKQSTSLLLKKLIAQDKQRAKQLKQLGAKSTASCFSQALVDSLSKEVLRSYTTCNKGCFLLINLIETDIESVATKIRSALQGINRSLAEKHFPGAKILRDKLKSN